MGDVADSGRGPNAARSVENVLVEIAAEVERQGARDARFVAVGIDVPAGAVNVWRTGDSGSRAADASYRALVPADVVLRMRRALLSQEQKLALDALVDANSAEFHARGFDPVIWGMLDGWEQPYVIGYEGPPTPPEDLVDAFAVFGAGTVVLRPEERPDGGIGIGAVNDRQS